MYETDRLNTGIDLSLADAIRILDECKQYSGSELQSVDILGGEPLLWPHLKDFILILNERQIRPWIFTNMLSITPELATWLFEQDVAITGKLNIDPRDPSQFPLQARMLGVRSSFVDKFLESIETFLSVGYKDPMFRLQNLIRNDNLEHVPGYYEYCLQNDIGTDLELMASGEAITEKYWQIAPKPEKIATMIKSIQELRKKYGLEELEVLMPHIFGSCPFYDAGIYFGANGDIRACSNSVTILGTLFETGSLKKAFESELFCNRFRLSKENVKEPCSSCDRWEKCRGGCRATAEGLGDPFAGYTLCPLPHLG